MGPRSRIAPPNLANLNQPEGIHELLKLRHALPIINAKAHNSAPVKPSLCGSHGCKRHHHGPGVGSSVTIDSNFDRERLRTNTRSSCWDTLETRRFTLLLARISFSGYAMCDRRPPRSHMAAQHTCWIRTHQANQQPCLHVVPNPIKAPSKRFGNDVDGVRHRHRHRHRNRERMPRQIEHSTKSQLTLDKTSEL